MKERDTLKIGQANYRISNTPKPSPKSTCESDLIGEYLAPLLNLGPNTTATLDPFAVVENFEKIMAGRAFCLMCSGTLSGDCNLSVEVRSLADALLIALVHKLAGDRLYLRQALLDLSEFALEHSLWSPETRQRIEDTKKTAEEISPATPPGLPETDFTSYREETLTFLYHAMGAVLESGLENLGPDDENREEIAEMVERLKAL